MLFSTAGRGQYRNGSLEGVMDLVVVWLFLSSFRFPPQSSPLQEACPNRQVGITTFFFWPLTAPRVCCTQWLTHNEHLVEEGFLTRGLWTFRESTGKSKLHYKVSIHVHSCSSLAWVFIGFTTFSKSRWPYQRVRPAAVLTVSEPSNFTLSLWSLH